MTNLITQLPNEVSTLIEIIEKKYISQGLIYGWRSVYDEYDTGHWNRILLNNSKIYPYDHGMMPYIKHHPELELLWNIIKLNFGTQGLLRLYVNGYTYGTDAYAHRDEKWLNDSFGEGSTDKTVILYLNKTWDKNWAGETVIFNDDDDIEFSVLPKYLRVISFDSLKVHAARPLSRLCKDLRKVLVFKTLSKKANSKEIDFLLNITKNYIHNEKSFFEHLYNTMLLLEKNQESKNLLAAGLFHSIYGTEHYKFNCDISREKLKNLIGDYSEQLVFEFCNLKDRTNSLINNTNNYDNNFNKDLLKIELANLEEQNNKNIYDNVIQKIKDKLNLS